MSILENQIDLLTSILTAISKRINTQSFNTWFKPISFATADDSTIYLRVPNEIFKDWITSNYFDVLEEALYELNLGNHKVDFLVEAKVSTKGSSDYKPTETNPRMPIELQLNPKYTFDTFVVGSCNQFAHAAALAVVDMSSKTYNPLYIYGYESEERTHLMHAIGNEIVRRSNNVHLVYITAEAFMNELMYAIRHDKTIAFRERYRNIDVLLMDNIQVLAENPGAQEEFFHTFNALYDSRKQIIISSNCPPREIPMLEERLHSRFEWGLIADIQPPDLETKVAILKRKAEIEKINMPDNVALFIASKIKSNVRELEESLVRLVAYASLKGLPISLELAQVVLKNIIDEESDRVSIELIQKTVASHYGLKVADLMSKNNSRSIAVPRQVAMYLCKTLTKASLPEIGREFGGRHHTTVSRSINKIAELYETDVVVHRLINSLITDIK